MEFNTCTSCFKKRPMSRLRPEFPPTKTEVYRRAARRASDRRAQVGGCVVLCGEQGARSG